jgi:hypothetical protein
MTPRSTMPAAHQTPAAVANHTASDLVEEILHGRQTGRRGVFQPSQLVSTHAQAFHGSDLNMHGGFPGRSGSMANGSDSVPDQLNCALFVLNLHPRARHTDLLGSIRNCGRVFSCWINRPIANHPDNAAKLVFTTRDGAEKFLNQARSSKGIHILGKRIKVLWNRHKYSGSQIQDQSRVVRINGPVRYVNRGCLREYFSKLFLYHTCAVFEGPVLPDGTRHIDWHFGSILAQAVSAKMAIEREPRFQEVGVTAEYLPDPCE